MDKIDELCKKVDKLTKLVTDIAKSLQLIPVTAEELAKFTKIRMKNEQLVDEAMQLIEENATNKEKYSLFSETQYNDTQSIYDDVLGFDYIGGAK